MGGVEGLGVLLSAVLQGGPRERQILGLEEMVRSRLEFGRTSFRLTYYERSKQCDFEFSTMELGSWTHTTEPIDDQFPRTLESAAENTVRDMAPYAGNNDQPHADEVATSDTAQGEDFDSEGAGQPPSPVNKDPFLKNVTMVYAPIYNYVFRAMNCMCRLVGDSSPFAPDIDIILEEHCRLHFPAKVARALDIELENPPQDYQPEKDPYFERFGGRGAFVAFAARNIFVQKSVNVESLLHPGLGWAAANEQLSVAWNVPVYQKALLDWSEDYKKSFIQWKMRIGPQAAAAARQKVREKLGFDEPTRKRRGSFS